MARILPHLCLMDLDSIEHGMIADIERREFERWLQERIDEEQGATSEQVVQAFIQFVADIAMSHHDSGDETSFYGHMVNVIDMLTSDRSGFIEALRSECEEKGRDS